MTARHVDWTHIRVQGDRERAASYIPDARKLLGQVMEEAARNGLGVHVAHRKLPDGTVIIAEKHGDIPRMTIVPTAVEEPRGKQVVGDVVVTPRDENWPDGFGEHPRLILSSSPGWKTYFFDSDTGPYEDFAGAKGLYANMFPDGVHYAGNVDWTGPEGERLSWYGPTSRYLFQPWRHAHYQYADLVCYLGRPIFWLQAYREDPGNAYELTTEYIMGAAWKAEAGSLWLYLVQSDIGTIDVTGYPASGDPGDLWVSPPVPPGPIQIDVVRYRLVRLDTAPGDPLYTYGVAPASHEVLFSEAIEGAVNPWFFSPTVDRVQTHTTAADVLVKSYNPGTIEDPGLATVWTLPAAENLHIELELDGGSVTRADRVLSLASPAGDGTHVVEVASDYDESGTRQVLAFEYEFSAAHGEIRSARWIVGGFSVPCEVPLRSPGLTPYLPALRRSLQWADLRVGAVAFLALSYAQGAAPTQYLHEQQIHLLHRGALFNGGTFHTAVVNTTFEAHLPLVRALDMLAEAGDPAIAHSAVFYALPGRAYAAPPVGSRLVTIMGETGHLGAHISPYDQVYGYEITFSRSTGLATGVAIRDRYTLLAPAEYPHIFEQDQFGMIWLVSGASNESLLAFAGTTTWYADGAYIPTHFISDGDLLDLTGVGVGHVRFSPIWMLGKPTQQTRKAAA